MNPQLSASIIFLAPIIAILTLLGIAVTIVKLAIKYFPVVYKTIKSKSNQINSIEIIESLFSISVFN
ncbi:MAG: hypothetical protein RLZZ171_1200 [Cyanobacteriota bacterium]|jgi:flagellar biosynthesis protein FlhB